LAGGIYDDQVVIVVANGHHRATSQEELKDILGPDLARRLKIINHDSMDGSNVVFVGTTEKGLPIYVNRYVAEAELKILTGIITPHQVAGYSGGRKSLVPGVAGYETIRKHHSYPTRSLLPVMGMMKGNTFHEEAVAGARLVGADFILNVVKNAGGDITAVVAGNWSKPMSVV